MIEQEAIASWIVSTSESRSKGVQTASFLEASRLAWPRVLAHARRKLSNKHFSSAELTSLVLEIWEDVLRSVWRLLGSSRSTPIANLEHYLIGSFHHRLTRERKKEKRRESALHFLPPEELIQLPSPYTLDAEYQNRVHRQIELDRFCAAVDARLRAILIARLYGLSWSEISQLCHVEEQRLIMRVQYAVRKNRVTAGFPAIEE